MTPPWLQQRERGSEWLMQAIAWLTRRLGRSAGRMLLPAICGYFVAFAPASRAASRAYLGRVLGRPAGLRDVYRHFHAFASTILDRVLLLSGNMGAFHIDIEGGDEIETLLAQRRGCLMLGAHFGSFEVLRAAGARIGGLTVNMLMETTNMPRIARVLGGLQPEAMSRVIPMGEPASMLQVKECIDRGEVVGILADRVFRDERSVERDFLGSTARFPLGPFRLAVALGAPTVMGLGVYLGGNSYTLRFVRMGENDGSLGTAGDRRARVEAMLAVYLQELERTCRTMPWNWFNFYDFWAADHGR